MKITLQPGYSLDERTTRQALNQLGCELRVPKQQPWEENQHFFVHRSTRTRVRAPEYRTQQGMLAFLSEIQLAIHVKPSNPPSDESNA